MFRAACEKASEKSAKIRENQGTRVLTNEVLVKLGDRLGHEQPAAQKPLRSETVHLVGCLVVADPLPCQTETAQIITQEEGADYVLGLKDNQPTVRQNAEKKLAAATPFLPRPTRATAGSKPGR